VETTDWAVVSSIPISVNIPGSFGGNG